MLLADDTFNEGLNHSLWQFSTYKVLLMRCHTEEKGREEQRFTWKREEGQMEIIMCIDGKAEIGKREKLLTGAVTHRTKHDELKDIHYMPGFV